MTIGLLFLAFFVLLGLSMPIGIAILAVCVGYILLTGGMQASFFISAFFSALDSFPLLAVPLFMLSGDLMTKGGIARQLFDLAHKLVGRLPGGHAMAAVLSCLFFGAVSGSAPATVAAIGGLMIPMLADIGYDRKWATGLLASAGALGVMIPPSIPMVMYGVVTGESVSDLFIAGIIPGILAVGFITPPIGMNLYVASGLTGLSVVEISKKIIIPMLLMIIAVLLVTYIPGISLCLLSG